MVLAGRMVVVKKEKKGGIRLVGAGGYRGVCEQLGVFGRKWARCGAL